MFTIIGSGFGIYGYLPAIITENREKVILPASYLEKIIGRKELLSFLPLIQWVENQDEALSKVDGVVVAVPPICQWEIVQHILKFQNIKRVILEKPLATDPVLAENLVSSVLQANKQFRVGYTFLFTHWHHEFNWPKVIDGYTGIEIRWNFLAHHFAKNLVNWKRKHSKGGGVLRFFGIHIIALLSEAGYTGVVKSILQGQLDEPEYWEAILTGVGLPDCSIKVNSRCEVQMFEIVSWRNLQKSLVVRETDPFVSEFGDVNQDKRVSVLKRLIATFNSQDSLHESVVFATNTLWTEIEEKTIWL
jgi:hypothetical protein